jgi:hypothetical protein
LLIVNVLSGLLLLEFSLVFLSILSDSLSDIFDRDIAVDIEFLVDAELLGNLERIDMLVFFKNSVLISGWLYNLGDIETLDLIFADLVVTPNNNIIYILASKHH